MINISYMSIEAMLLKCDAWQYKVDIDNLSSNEARQVNDDRIEIDSQEESDRNDKDIDEE